MYDLYAPLITDSKFTLTYEEAQELVLRRLSHSEKNTSISLKKGIKPLDRRGRKRRET